MLGDHSLKYFCLRKIDLIRGQDYRPLLANQLSYFYFFLCDISNRELPPLYILIEHKSRSFLRLNKI